jgi:hypothetical protein
MKSVELSSARRSILVEIAGRKAGFSCQGEIGEFIDNYLVAESLLRRLISYYASDTGRKPSENLQTIQIEAALNHFKVSVNQADVIDSFQGGPGKRGFKSARQLRNGYLHDLNPDDRAELLSKWSLVKQVLSRVVSPLLATASVA